MVFILKQPEKVDVLVFRRINAKFKRNDQTLTVQRRTKNAEHVLKNNAARSGRVEVNCLLDRKLHHIPY